MGMISDFKSFALGGNLIDMATGIIIGVASGKLISSLVENVIMPPIGVLLGGTNFSNLKVVLTEAGGGEKGLDAVSLNYGAFIQSFVDFLIIMLVVFIIVKVTTRNEVEKAPAGPSQEDLLTEIRDSLKK